MNKIIVILFVLCGTLVYSQKTNTFVYPVIMTADSNRITVGAQAGYVWTCMDNAGNMELAPASGGGAALDAGQIGYGNADSSGITSDANHTIDPTTGAFLSVSSDGVTNGAISHTPNSYTISLLSNETSSTGQLQGDTGQVVLFYSNGIDTNYYIRVGRTNGVVNTSGGDGIVFKSADATFARMPDNLFGTAGQTLTTDGAGQMSWSGGSGVYIPDTSDASDITDFVIDSASYTRVGNVVTVNGYISDISTGITGGTISLSLPIASNIARVGQLTGTASTNEGAAGGGAYIIGHVATDRAVLTTPPTALTNNIITYTFSYLIY